MYNRLFYFFTKKYLKIPQLDVEIQDDGESLYINGKKIEMEDTNSLQSEATFLKNSILFKSIMHSLKTQAEEDIFKNSRTTEDLYFPKATLYVVNSLINQIDNLKSKHLTDKIQTSKVEDVSKNKLSF